MNKQVFVVLLGLYSSVLYPQISEADKKFIERTFSVIESLCLKDNGRMWGIDLHRPCMVVDRESHLIIANKPDEQGLLRREENLFTGTYPDNKTIASSITVFGGTDFAIVAYPFNFPDAYLKVQLVHEIFHMLQDTLGLDPPHMLYHNAHLDELHARIYIRLEWEALEQAFEAISEEDRTKHIRYALKFRRKRRSLYPGAAETENNMEIKEGIPEFTGHMLTSNSFREYTTSIGFLEDLIKPLPSYATNFAYYSGCLYGGLLSVYDRNWTRKLESTDDLGELLLRVCRISTLDSLINNDFIDSNYHATNIKKMELEHWMEKEKLKLHYIEIFTKDPILFITIKNWNMKLYPTEMMPLDSLGTVHNRIEIIDQWGKLTVNGGGCLLNGDNAALPSKNLRTMENKVYTDNWNLILNDGWILEKAEDSFRLYKR